MAEKVLIVEDEMAMLNVLADKFKREGFDVFKAADGDEGLEAALKERPNLILLDILMPKMDGMTFLRKLREDIWGKNATVVILTNLVDPRVAAETSESGVFDYWVKTELTLDEIVEKVRGKLKMPPSAKSSENK